MTRVDMREGKPTVGNGWQYRALLDGEDVSARCFMADDETGDVGLYLQRDGAFYVDEETCEPAQEFKHGAVTLIAPTESA